MFGDRPAASATATLERLAVTAYDLQVHLRPADAAMSVVARMTLRNDGAEALKEVALEISGGLHWESVSVRGGSGLGKAPFRETVVDTDADHTGTASEVVVTLPEALAAKGTVEVSAIYSGVMARSAARLERIGVPEDQATAADWDEVGAGGTFLRGFGNALWYPVAGPPVFLGDGAAMVRAAGEQRGRNAAATMRLRLEVEYVGEAPGLAFLCGEMEPLRGITENADAPVADAPGVATAELRLPELGFRLPTIFVTDRPAATSRDGLISAVTADESALPRYAGAAGRVAPVLREWMGPTPREPLYVIDHAGQAFAEGALLVTPMAPAKRETGTAELDYTVTQAMAHAWFRSRQVWMEEGVAHLMQLLWMERTGGRAAALAQMGEENHGLALAEAGGGETSAEARTEVFYRTKAADVLWMLRGLVGDSAMKRVLTQFARGNLDAAGLERGLEAESGKDLKWFFDDWVLHDRGLPELEIVNVAVRAGLVAVEVKNDGGAAAEVPVTVRAGGLTATETLRVAGHGTASVRVVFQGQPEEVQVNDGSVPEGIAGVHVRKLGATP